jgi:cytochrome c oxidase subunit II
MRLRKLIVIGITVVVIVGASAFFRSSERGRVNAATTLANGEQVIHITAKKFAYSPAQIVLKKGEPVVLELTSQDREHGFRQEELGIRVDVKPGETDRVRLVPQQTGSFTFACDVFCGSGHEEMAGEIAVVD